MTQKYNPAGEVIPVTKVEAGPCFVTQIKTVSSDGYYGLQVGFGKKKRINKPLAGHLKKLGNFKYLKEFRPENEKDNTGLAVGDKIEASVFNPGDTIDVSGISKGKGFQGVVRRWGFHGHPATHGHKDQLRMPGSSGAGGVQHVFKGVKKPGRMGGDQITIKNLEIIDRDVKNNWLYVKGAIPGGKNGLIWIYGDGEMAITKDALASVNPAEVKAEAAAKEAAVAVADKK